MTRHRNHDLKSILDHKRGNKINPMSKPKDTGSSIEWGPVEDYYVKGAMPFEPDVCCIDEYAVMTDADWEKVLTYAKKHGWIKP